MHKLITYICLLCAFLTPAFAAVLKSVPGPKTYSSFTMTPSAAFGYDLAAQASSLNTVTYDAELIKHGLGGSGYYIEIRVKTVGDSTYTYYSISSGMVEIGSSVQISVPANKAYNVTFWISSSQSYNASNYNSIKFTNIVISN